jgi:DNA-binding PadR family transcriptional regulator
MHHLREIFRDLRDHPAGHMRHHMGKHRHGRGFGHFFGSDIGDAGFDRSGFRTGRKLAADDLQLLLLTLIAEKPSHGYDLIKVLGERSGGYYVPSPGMIYPALTYLEEAGHATVEPEGTKKLYRISEDGRRHLDQNRTAADALVSQLERIGRRMGDVRRAFAADGEEAGDDGDSNELRQARRELRRVLRERRRGSAEESRRIADILRRATADILGKQ